MLRHHWKTVSMETSLDACEGFCPFISHTRLGTQPISVAPLTWDSLYQDRLTRGMSAPFLSLLSHTRRTTVKEPLPHVPTALSSENIKAYSKVSVSDSLVPLCRASDIIYTIGFNSDAGVSAWCWVFRIKLSESQTNSCKSRKLHTECRMHSLTALHIRSLIIKRFNLGCR